VKNQPSQRLKSLLKSKVAKRVYRAAAFTLGTGIAFLGAGSIQGYSALESARFGATGALLGLIGALAFIYASKAEVTDKDFDQTINSAIETVNSKTADKDKKTTK
jgi:hypothetical protein